MATRDGSAQIWYADANGVVTGYTPNADNVVSAIIDTYNKHFGTDIQIWTPETKTLQVGGTVPNWNAYEKILIQLEDGLYKFDLSGGASRVFACMEIQNGSVGIYASSLESGSNLNVYNLDGSFNAANGSENILTAITQICSRYPNFVSVSRQMKNNANLENWDEYTLLS